MTASPMRDWEQRGLTLGEIALARCVFANQIAYEAVRLVQAPLAPWAAMVPIGRHIIFGASWRAPRDFALSTPHAQGWLIHELAHVWQARRGAVLAFAKLSALGGKAYVVRRDSAAAFAARNIEEQAEIARFTFLARQAGRPDPWLEALWPISCPST